MVQALPLFWLHKSVDVRPNEVRALVCIFLRRGVRRLHSASDAPLFRRAIPTTGEMLPIVGISTSWVFDRRNNRDEWRERQAVLQHLFDGAGTLIDAAPS